jgi:hypothetical protein
MGGFRMETTLRPPMRRGNLGTAMLASNRFISLIWRHELISFAFGTGAFEIKYFVDHRLKDHTHKLSPMLG